jgi:hypothetical protein
LLYFNFRTLGLFEEYLLSECGDLSEESLSYQLWRAVTSCLAQKNKAKRDSMALNIQQKFIFEDSDHHLELAGSQLQLLDPNQEVRVHVTLRRPQPPPPPPTIISMLRNSLSLFPAIAKTAARGRIIQNYINFTLKALHELTIS